MRPSVTALICVALLGGAALAGAAGAERNANAFGAIAVNASTGAYGFSFDYPTRASAEERALRECRVRSRAGTCRPIAWVRNGCAAVSGRKRSDGSLSRITWGIGESRASAQSRARARCQESGQVCRFAVWTCTRR